MMFEKTSFLAAVGMVLCWTGSPVSAQEHTHGAPQEEKAPHVHTDSEPHDAHKTHDYHSNEVALLLAGTYESAEEETFFTIGGEYQRLFTPRMGVSAAFEHINDVGAWIVVATFVFRPVASLKLTAGPGVELMPRRPEEHGGEEEPGGHTESSSTEPTDRNESLFLWRFGAGYGFEIGERFSLTPGVSLDFVWEGGHWVEALVFGATFGVGF